MQERKTALDIASENGFEDIAKILQLSTSSDAQWQEQSSKNGADQTANGGLADVVLQ